MCLIVRRARSAVFFMLLALFSSVACASFTIIRAESTYDVHADATYTLEVQFIMRANDTDGIKEISQFPLTYSVALQKMDVLEAYTTTADGKRIDVTADKILEQQSPASAQAPMFGDIRVKTVVFPAVETGAVVTLRYRMTQIKPLYPGAFSMAAGFNRNAGFKDGQITLRAPVVMPMKIEAIDLQGGEMPSDQAGTRIWRWTIANATATPPEAGSINVMDVSPRVKATSFQDYDAVARAYLERARPTSKVTPAVQKLADEITVNIVDRQAQTRALYDWVSSHIRYVAIYLGAGGVIPHDADAILEARYGDCKDHVTLLEALLAAKGIASSPVLINAANSYAIPGIAVPEIFNHAITYVPEFKLFLDSTAAILPLGLLAPTEYGKTALVTDDGTGKPKLVTVPLMNPDSNSTQVRTLLSVADDGTVSGQSTIASSGVYQVNDRATFAAISKTQMQQVVANMLAVGGQTGSGNFDAKDPRDLEHEFSYSSQFKLPGFVLLPGPGAFVVPRGLGSLNGALQSVVQAYGLAERKFPYACTSAHREEITALILPDSVKISALPKPVRIESRYGSYESNYESSGSTITIKRTLVTKFPNPVCNTEDYVQVKEMANAIAKDLRANILYQ